MRWVLVLAVAVLAAGCGGQKKTADEKTGAGLAKVETTCVEGLNCEAPEVKAAGRSCNPAGQGYRGREFRACSNRGVPSNPTIERRTAAGWTVVTGPLKPAEPSAQWGAVWISPNRRMLLAEWQYPCDSSAAVFVSASGGKPRLVTGERDWRTAPVARALGWTSDGKARVQIFKRWRGHPPGIYRFDPQVRRHEAGPTARAGC